MGKINLKQEESTRTMKHSHILSHINTHVTYEAAPFTPDEEEEDEGGDEEPRRGGVWKKRRGTV